jgi:hypothetical protein
MLRMLIIPLGGMLVGACAATNLHPGKTTLLPPETATVVSQGKDTKGGGFRRIWKSPTLHPWRLLKWDQDRSSVTADAPAGLLQNVRDEIGRVNQRDGHGEDLLLAVTVYVYRAGGWFSNPKAHYELVARDGKGKAVWVADDEVVARADMARSLVDPEEAVIAREIARKLREEFGL